MAESNQSREDIDEPSGKGNEGRSMPAPVLGPFEGESQSTPFVRGDEWEEPGAASPGSARERDLERRNGQLEQFVGVVVHDLRNPLSVAKGYVEFGLTNTDDPETEEYLEEVDESLDRMDNLIEDLLTLARRGEVVGEVEEVDLEDVAREAWRNVETGDAELVVDAGSVEADVSCLLRLFENLFRNSVEHGSTGSRMESDDSFEHGGGDVRVRVGDTRDGFFVEDDGVGVAEEEWEDILSRGYTSGGDGHGLGLSIVTSIADAHGWDVEVGESREGGVRFDFLLDLDGGD